MSGATGAGAGGPRAEGGAPSGPATAPEGARGPAGEGGGRQDGSSRKDPQGGGTTTDTRQLRAQPQPQPQPQPQAQPQSGQPYHPPQAYPSPAGGGGDTGGRASQAGHQQSVRRPRPGARTTPRIRKARLRVAKADPWSVMKVSFLLSIALGICTIVAVAVLWMVMDAMGVFSTVGGTISEATGSNEGNGFDLQSFLSLPRVLAFTSIIAVIDIVLATALATLGAFIYNLSAGFVGGVELTLAEDE
ncbi:DUF3566 domain-containing protein [Streptomyces sp. 8N706]|uniref:DUF3566 domain-containing protein n=1 Tax=Streptomyces sp. 8N706 TaxID=3457416 RepID=UPI003FD255E4